MDQLFVQAQIRVEEKPQVITGNTVPSVITCGTMQHYCNIVHTVHFVRNLIRLV